MQRVLRLPGGGAVTTADVLPLATADLDAIDARWANAPRGPWRAVQIHGFGAENFIVSDHPDAAWYAIVAKICNAGGFGAMDAMARARAEVPALVAEVRRLRAASDEREDAAFRAGVEAAAKECDALGSALYDDAVAAREDRDECAPWLTAHRCAEKVRALAQLRPSGVDHA